ncbi:hypothetical protein [Winogradskyella sp. SYSU M77433]|uniref:hypothetical protein n=1 Tax=Winogradskyella sp. SYSU M77433 TaxID=3042722 RepID=UPI00247FAC10|nr:hypothetical protein [Winogradskyella sp. SYSU M77433]MDH7913105.1 hypothetical protein [Winogradskyella sp. SYSU M77433]
MKNQFKLLLLTLITSAMGFGQVKEIFKKSYDAKNLKSINLQLNGTYVEFSESEDDKVHFDYTLEFENYSKKELESKLNEIETEVQIVNGILEFKTSGSEAKSDISYSLETLYGITFEGDFINFKEETNRKFRKSKQYFLAINSSSRGKSIKEYLKNLRELDDKGNKRKINTNNVKILKTKFSIKLPPEIMLKIMAENSSLTFQNDLKNQLVMNTRHSSLKFQNIENPLNVLDVVNGSFRANVLEGGSYKFTHADEVQVAQLKSVNIDTEFSDVKIGEIAGNVRIVDFNSKFWFHNFSQDFKEFKMESDYSEINLFFPEKSSFFIETYGYNTVHYWGDIITEIPPSRKKERSKMMLIGEEVNPNKIKINITNGIIRFGEDFIDVKK